MNPGNQQFNAAGTYQQYGQSPSNQGMQQAPYGYINYPAQPNGISQQAFQANMHGNPVCSVSDTNLRAPESGEKRGFFTHLLFVLIKGLLYVIALAIVIVVLFFTLFLIENLIEKPGDNSKAQSDVQILNRPVVVGENEGGGDFSVVSVDEGYNSLGSKSRKEVSGVVGGNKGSVTPSVNPVQPGSAGNGNSDEGHAYSVGPGLYSYSRLDN